MANTIIAKIAARAKVIRKAKPTMSWQTAIKKASAELKGTTVRTTSKRRVATPRRKKTVGDPIIKAYERAPKKVKDILDEIDDYKSYTQMANIANRLYKLGWEMQYGLDADIQVLRPIRKKTTKKVGATKKLTDAQLEKIASDYAYVTSSDYDRAVYRLQDPDYTDKLLPQYLKAIKDYEKRRKIKISGKKVGKATNPVKTKHKDTKSHNVNIRVMSGTKRPKIQKASVDMNALNGIIQYERGKFYQLMGRLKGVVIKITKVKKIKHPKYPTRVMTEYEGLVYDYKDGHLLKPVKGIFQPNFLDMHNAYVRPSVKAHEYKKYV
jgi:hypothetical protein